MVDLICPICSGLVYRFHVLIEKPFKCVRCDRTFSERELFNPEVRRMIDENKDIVDECTRKAINRLLKELL